MSRADHVVARRMESARSPRRYVQITQWRGYRFMAIKLTAAEHKQGSPWWRAKFADLAEKRRAVSL